MNLTLILALLRQRFTSPGRLVLLFMGFTFPLAILAATRGGLGLEPLRTAGLFTFVLGAGMIGGEASSGVFQLLFARPVTRSEYLLSRWFAVGLGAAILSGAQLGIAAAILAANGAQDLAGTVLGFWCGQTMEAFALAAMIACFSSFLPGFGDVFALVAAQIVVGFGRMAAQFGQKPALEAFLGHVEQSVKPEVRWESLVQRGHVEWPLLVAWASTVTLGLAIAVWVLNRREISYATD